MPETTLPISRLINVAVNLTPQSAQAQDLSTVLVLGTSDVIDVVERMRSYASLEEVAAEFGTTLPEYLAALLYFEQSPQPRELKIGRWVNSPSSGQLIGGSLDATSKLIATWTAINNGNFGVEVNGVPQVVNGINTSGVTNLNGVATAINAVLVGATVAYDSVNDRFVFTSNSAGVGSSIGFLTTGAAVDISTLLFGQINQGGYVADGLDAETPAAAVTIFNDQFGQTWYGLVIPGLDNDQHLTVAALVEGLTNKHIYGITTQEAGALSAVSTTDIVYLLNALAYKRTFTQYSSSNAYAVMSALAKALSVDYTGNSTVIDLMYKQEPGIVAESLTSSQVGNLEDKNGNVFVAYNNDTAILEKGNVASGDPLDIITGTDWLAVDIMTALYNLLYTSPTKIPQTDAGTHLLVTTIESRCGQGVVNGLLAAGTWNSAGFGTLKEGDFLPKGFYVYAPPISSQLQSDREQRISVPIQVAAKLAGAVRTVDVTINVNR